MRSLPLPALLCALGVWTATARADGQWPAASVTAHGRLLGEAVADVTHQTGALIVADPNVAERRIEVEITGAPLDQVLEQLAIAAVGTWDSAYLLVPASSPFAGTTAPGWQTPLQVPITLQGGTADIADVTRALTLLSAASVGYDLSLADAKITTQPCTNTPLEAALDAAAAAGGLAVAKGFRIMPIDRAAIFGRYGVLPPQQREAQALHDAQQMLRLDPEAVRRVLEQRHREFAKLEDSARTRQIDEYAQEIRQGIQVLNTLPPAVRATVRDAMRVFFDQGMLVYRDLTLEEQLEATPIIEAMGELER